MQKYFLALIPPADILKKAEAIKVEIQEKYSIKYALKSPSHVTLKMPFSYNEAKEDQLASKLSDFLQDKSSFPISMNGVGTFGKRVVFLGIEKSQELLDLQKELRIFCKQQLHMEVELSDKNYTPHMTIAFKDLKETNFEGVLELVKSRSFGAKFNAENIALLKRIDGRWILLKSVPFGG